MITVTNTGYIKRTPLTTYRTQRRGGKGRIGMRTREEDFVSHLFVATTHAYILIFTDRGRAYWLRVHEVPDVGRGSKGKAIANLVQHRAEARRSRRCSRVQEFPEQEEQQFIVMGTRKGTIKKTDLTAFCNPRAGGIIAMGVEDGDAVIAVELTDGKEQIFIGTRNGMAIRFAEDDVRPMGRSAYGVRGITLREGDEVVAMEVVREGGTLLTVAQNGYGKRTELERVPPPVARRHRPHEHPDLRPQRQGRRHRLRARRRRADADHAAGHDPADEGRRHPPDRPRHAGRAADRDGRGRQRRLGREAGGEGRRGGAEPEAIQWSGRALATDAQTERTP